MIRYVYRCTPSVLELYLFRLTVIMAFTVYFYVITLPVSSYVYFGFIEMVSKPFQYFLPHKLSQTWVLLTRQVTVSLLKVSKPFPYSYILLSALFKPFSNPYFQKMNVIVQNLFSFICDVFVFLVFILDYVSVVKSFYQFQKRNLIYVFLD